MPSVFYMGRSLEDMSRDELIAIICDLNETIRRKDDEIMQLRLNHLDDLRRLRNAGRKLPWWRRLYHH